MARHILQQRTIMMRYFSGALLSNCFPNWLQPQERGQQFFTFWSACAHSLNYQSTLPFPTPLCFSRSLFFLSHDWQARIPTLYHKSQDRSSTPASLAPAAPQESAWAIIDLLSYHTLTDEGPGAMFPFPIRTQQCCAGLSQQLRGQRRKYSSSEPCFSVRPHRSYRATPLSCTTYQSHYCMLRCALGCSNWL